MKRINKVALFLVAFAMVMGVSMVAAPSKADAAKVKVKSVKVASPYSKRAYIAKGKSIKLSKEVKVNPNKSANKKVTFVSKNKKIATVSSSGKVKAKKVGTTKIVVTSKKNKKKKTTITVKVKSGAVTKVKLNKKSASINVGESLALKSSVSAKKGASKNLYWKSSKKSVATVSQKGVVAAKGVGSATITVRATDGSNKKATCKINVGYNVNMTGMNVLNHQSVSFSLDRPYALAANQIAVKTRRTSTGAYNNGLMIDSIVTTDNVNYTVVTSSETIISENDFVQLSIPSLPGSVKSMEKQYVEAATAYTEDSVYSCMVGNGFSKFLSFGKGIGYSSYSLVGLPAGLTYEVKNDYVSIKGKPSAVGIYRAVLTAVDEMGNTYTKNCTFCVGSSTAIAAAVADKYYLLGAEGVSIDAGISAIGGSGSYTYTKAPDGSGLTVSSSGYISGTIKIAGSYTINIHIVDNNNPAIATDVAAKINVAQGNAVTGSITDAQGNPINGVEVEFTNKNKGDRYCTSCSLYTDNKGSYSALLATGNYDVKAYYGMADVTRYLYNQSVTATGPFASIALPVYKVALVSNDGVTSLNGLTWYNDLDEVVGRGSTLYLKSGAYNLHSDTISTGGVMGGKKNATISFTITNTAVQYGATVVTTGGSEPSLIGEGDTVVTYSGSHLYYKFIPSETATYNFKSTGGSSLDPYITLYDENESKIGYDDDMDDGDYNFSLSRQLTQGKTYYIDTYAWNNGSYHMVITKN